MGIQRRILVVDDEPVVVKTLSKAIRRQGFDVVSAVDGEEALEKIRSTKPDLVILDIQMPKLDGTEVLQRIKGSPETASLPVIMLTGKAGDEDILKGYKYGANYYIPKPFKMDEVLKGIALMVRSIDEEASHRFKI